MKNEPKLKSAILLFLLISISQSAFSDASAEIKYRQGVMGVVGGHMKSMGTILKGQVHMEDLQFHAKAMARIADIVPTVFPEGSGKGKTEALPAIWEDKTGFKTALDKFIVATQEMAKASESGEMSVIGPAIQNLGGSCKGCHDNFKEE